MKVGLGRSKGSSRWVVGLIGFGLLIAMLVTILLVWRLISDLELQRSASSDNMQWTLTQIEVEHLTFLNALEHQTHDSAVHEGPTDIESIRRGFDIFYSRVDTVKAAARFAELRETPEFARALASVSTYLDDAVPIIDGSDAALRAQIGTLLERTSAIRSEVRALALDGLTFFAEQGDARRAQTTRTLKQLATFSSILLAVLAVASIYLLFVNRMIRRGSRALAEANQRINTVLSTASDAVIVSDKAGAVLEFNAAAERIFGYKADDAIGRSIAQLIVPPHLRDAHEAGMERMQSGGEPHILGQGPTQMEAMRANGELFPADLLLQSAKDGNEEIFIGFIRDISKQVADEKELISARDKALAGQKAKDDFLTVMSHEIRTPLNGILGNLALLEASELTPEQKRFTRNMEISGEVMLSHVNSVLDIARFEAGKLKLEPEAVNLSELLQDIVDGQSGLAAQNGNVIRWHWVGAPSPWVKADVQRLRQILLNLVSNAIKFTLDGQITIEVEKTGETGHSGEPFFEFRVIDTGFGIEESSLDAVFDDFYTMDTSLDRVSGGTGLGLGIARRLTQAMNGEIGVESEPGDGSVFWIRVALPYSAPQQTSEPKARSGPIAGSLDLLVVEDNEINLELIRSMLEKEGHRVTVARDGKTSVERAAEHVFDAILMDISMPVMDGLAATRHIRNGNGRSAQTPIIAVSANVLPDAVEKFRTAGMNAFVSKPIGQQSLRKALQVVLDDTSGEFVGTNSSSSLEQMRNDLGEATFAGLARRFIDEADALMLRLKSAPWQNSDQDELKSECHRVAGSATLFNAEPLRDVLIDIEAAVENRSHDELSALVHKAKGAWARTREQLSEFH